MALISLEHVTKRYKDTPRPALDDVSLKIDRGEFVFLVGASGAGKSSLLSILLREEKATSGSVHVAGHDLRRLPSRQVPAYRREIGFIFQDYKLLENRTVYENVAFALQVIGMRRSQINPLVMKALKDVGLESKAEKRPHELSGGECQRVSIARAYVNHPHIILADEPTGNLDPTTSVGIMKILNAINLTGTTIVMATHNEEIVNSMHKRVLELNSGRLVRDERNGKYDSSRYFPDVDTERESTLDDAPLSDDDADETKAAAQGRAQARIETASAAPGAEDAQHDDGIEALEQTIHSGQTGVYGQVFENVEDTLSWGKGVLLNAQTTDKEPSQSNDGNRDAHDGARDAKFRPQASADGEQGDTEHYDGLAALAQGVDPAGRPARDADADNGDATAASPEPAEDVTAAAADSEPADDSEDSIPLPPPPAAAPAPSDASDAAEESSAAAEEGNN